MRAPFQVLIFPFIKNNHEEILYALFKRADMDIWQAIAGGGESDETPIDAAKREAFEEASINPESSFIPLSSVTSIPACNIHDLIWGDIIMIPEISFGVELQSKDLQLSHEHKECIWLTCEEAMGKLKYDSNKSALWELDYRLKNDLRGLKENRDSIKKYYT